MKKNFFYIAALAVITAACTNEDALVTVPTNNGTSEGKMITETISATNGDASSTTRVDIGNGNNDFAWTKGDNIAVHVSNGTTHKYVFTSGEGGASASAAEASFTVAYEEGYSRNAFAIYPASIVATDAANYGDGTALDVTLPASYTLAEVSGTTSPCPMIATNTPGNGWTFYQLCGMLRLTVNSIPDDAEGIVIQFPGKKVNGTFSIASTVTPGTSTIVTGVPADGEDKITVTFPAGTTTATVNIPLPTGTYDDVIITSVGGSSKVAAFQEIKAGGYTAARAHGKKLTTTLVAGFNLANASFDTSSNPDPVPFAYIYQSDAGTATPNTITIADGQTVILDGVNILSDLSSNNAIKCVGNAEIVLSGTNTVKSSESATINNAIIQAGSYYPRTTLTISGNGSLTVATTYNGSHMGALIGSDKNGDCGNITITGGTIEAYARKYNNGAAYGACIGAGSSYSGTSRCGDITISGGKVTVDTHKGGGAGIGSGCSENSSGYSTCGTITISGGKVTAQSWEGGAAIGSGRSGINSQNPSYNGYSKCDGIVIEGTADVTARSTANASQSNSYAGAAIGTGSAGQIGDIEIRGGTVKATMTDYHAPGIGAAKFRSTCGNIIISGGTVEATGGEKAAGIGNTRGLYKCVSTCGTITITTGVTSVKATMGSQGNRSIGNAGGASTGTPYFCTCGTVTIGGTAQSSGGVSTSPYTYTPPTE